MSFRLKTLLGVALIQLAVTGVMVLVNQLNFGGAARAQLEERAAATVQLFATMVTDAVISTDLATLDSMVENTLKDGEIVYIHIHDAGEGEGARDAVRFDVSAPVVIGAQDFGRVELGVSTARVEARIAEAVRWNVTIAAIGIALVAVFGTLLSTLLTRQLMSLRRGAMRLEAGDLTHRVPVQGATNWPRRRAPSTTWPTRWRGTAARSRPGRTTWSPNGARRCASPGPCASSRAATRGRRSISPTATTR